MAVECLNRLNVIGNKDNLKCFKKDVTIFSENLSHRGQYLGQGTLDVRRDFVECVFTTFLDPPKPWLDMVSADYPQLTFLLDFAIPKRALKGRIVVRDKKVLEDICEAYDTVEDLISAVNGDDIPFVLDPGYAHSGRLGCILDVQWTDSARRKMNVVQRTLRRDKQ